MHKRLFIPGPVEVIEENLQRMATPMIGHRSKDFEAPYARLQPKLQQLFATTAPVYIATSSSTGLWEASVRCLVRNKCLVGMQGAFSDRWHNVAEVNGKDADKLRVEWGQAITPDMVDAALSKGGYDAFLLVHNETSTGVMNPLEEIAELMRRKYSDMMFVIDAVSSLAAVPIDVDRLGIDMLLAGTQKAIGLPPGIAVGHLSARGMERAVSMTNRGYYFDLVEMHKYHLKNQTHTTPSISHIFALDHQMDRMLEEGLANRYARHRKMALYTRAWAMTHFELFAPLEYASESLTCIRNTREIKIADLNAELGKRGALISNGYGKIKDLTFRIAHMADHQYDEIVELLGWIDEILGLPEDGRVAGEEAVAAGSNRAPVMA